MPGDVYALAGQPQHDRRAVPGQRWTDGTAFSHPCCGASEYNSTERDGAVVIVVEGRSVRIWLPPV